MDSLISCRFRIWVGKPDYVFQPNRPCVYFDTTTEFGLSLTQSYKINLLGEDLGEDCLPHINIFSDHILSNLRLYIPKKSLK